MIIFFKLLIGHALADYPLQGDFIGKFKSPLVASPIQGRSIWWHLLTAHALIHAGAVWFVTGSVHLAFAEFVLHWVIDHAKGLNLIGFHTDQALHVACKVLYAISL